MSVLKPISPNEFVELGFSAGPDKLPRSLSGLFIEAIECYRQYHANLISVYLIGTMATGQWIEGTSDVDTVGIVSGPNNAKADAQRRSRLAVLSDNYAQISYVDSRIVHQSELDGLSASSPTQSPMLSIFKVCGVRLWGEQISLPKPTIHDALTMCVGYPQFLFHKYRSGNLIEQFQLHPELLSRSCAKSALRVLFGIAILRGAPLEISWRLMAAAIEQYVPEAESCRNELIAIIAGGEHSPDAALKLADTSIGLFRQLMPDYFARY